MFTCSACGAPYDDDAWRRLALARLLEPPEVRMVVRTWPDGQCIEVRYCGRCDGLIAVKRRWPPATGAPA
jgi:hypothetical protein